MTMNLIVPLGMVRFVFFNNENQKYREEQIGATNYSLLTVPPGIWFGFQGISDSNSMILNLANMIHSSKEIDRKSIDEINLIGQPTNESSFAGRWIWNTSHRVHRIDTQANGTDWGTADPLAHNAAFRCLWA